MLANSTLHVCVGGGCNAIGVFPHLQTTLISCLHSYWKFLSLAWHQSFWKGLVVWGFYEIVQSNLSCSLNLDTSCTAHPHPTNTHTSSQHAPWMHSSQPRWEDQCVLVWQLTDVALKKQIMYYQMCSSVTLYIRKICHVLSGWGLDRRMQLQLVLLLDVQVR